MRCTCTASPGPPPRWRLWSPFSWGALEVGWGWDHAQCLLTGGTQQMAPAVNIHMTFLSYSVSRLPKMSFVLYVIALQILKNVVSAPRRFFLSFMWPWGGFWTPQAPGLFPGAAACEVGAGGPPGVAGARQLLLRQPHHPSACVRPTAKHPSDFFLHNCS